ncbi:hypothetical protein DPMN_191593 [Dreissena polymorpha]|uniref:Uncharacterized protein n=1 Tax=Dreissena polymorpha TaxID=45954 RepID=A0A9D4BFZ7_DREPO|nr:hypothetical protein DPMN_191593 [Dreissena polymorpha]
MLQVQRRIILATSVSFNTHALVFIIINITTTNTTTTTIIIIIIIIIIIHPLTSLAVGGK